MTIIFSHQIHGIQWKHLGKLKCIRLAHISLSDVLMQRNEYLCVKVSWYQSKCSYSICIFNWPIPLAILNGEDILPAIETKKPTPRHLIPLVLCHTGSVKEANLVHIWQEIKAPYIKLKSFNRHTYMYNFSPILPILVIEHQAQGPALISHTQCTGVYILPQSRNRKPLLQVHIYILGLKSHFLIMALILLF